MSWLTRMSLFITPFELCAQTPGNAFAPAGSFLEIRPLGHTNFSHTSMVRAIGGSVKWVRWR